MWAKLFRKIFFSRSPKIDKNDRILSSLEIFAFSKYIFRIKDEVMPSQIFLCSKYAWIRTSAEKLIFFQYFPKLVSRLLKMNKNY